MSQTNKLISSRTAPIVASTTWHRLYILEPRMESSLVAQSWFLPVDMMKELRCQLFQRFWSWSSSTTGAIRTSGEKVAFKINDSLFIFDPFKRFVILVGFGISFVTNFATVTNFANFRDNFSWQILWKSSFLTEIFAALMISLHISFLLHYQNLLHNLILVNYLASKRTKIWCAFWKRCSFEKPWHLVKW